MRQKISGEERETVAVSYGNLGIICLDLGQFIEAKEYLEKALIIQKKIYGEEHNDVATSYNNLAHACKVLQESNEAKEHYKKAVIIKEKIFHEEHAEVADIYGHLAIICVKLGQYSEAKKYKEKRAQIVREIDRFLHSVRFNNLAAPYFYEGNIEAKRNFDSNFEIAFAIELADVDSNLSQCEQPRRKCCILI